MAARADELQASSPGAIAATTVATIALLVLLGYGWSRFVLGVSETSMATAAAFGAGALMLGAFVIDRVGIGLGGRLGPLVASALTGTSGYALAFGRRAAEVREG
jgi:hypothetical protein